MNHSASDAAAASRDGDTKKHAHDGSLTNGASMAIATPKGPTPDQHHEDPPEIEHVGDEHQFPRNAEANKRKKLLLLQFAQEQRAKFIKLLVLTEWGKKAAKDLTRLIDLFRWASEQAQHMEAADYKLDRIKVLSNNARENSPDIATALEVLSSGKAPWMPSLGYIPPSPYPQMRR
ncbi:hypothetical protein P3342_011890 [Pyrenophora teres f. teres]|nr:hypothetical protein P3342_011890 [Pyrenophora teres f. teres]